MASLKNNTELADIFDTDTNGVLVADKKGVIINTNEMFRSYFQLSEYAGVSSLVGDLIPDTQGDAVGCIRSVKAVNERRLKEKQARVVANISPNIGQREVAKASIGLKKQHNDYEQLSKQLDAYKRQNKLLEAIFNASSDGLWIVDKKVLWIVGNENDLSELKALREELEKAKEVTEKVKEELTGLNMAELREQEIVVKSKAMLQVLRVANKLAKIDASHILITGESGTGKGLLAKFIHKKSARASRPFIQINCAAVPENLLEAELFGYEKGAFTGAGDKGKAGLLELAHGGTLFLDEIGDMPMRLQAKLLKYLDDHEVMRLGSVKTRKIDCAILSATNQDLEALVEQKQFRQDLLFRLNHFPIHIPPLRERAEDIVELVHFFIRKTNKEYKRRKRISAQGIETMQAYAFPGNVRELRSLCKQAVLMSEETLLDRYFAENLQKVCAPAGLAAANTPVWIDSAAASTPDGNDPAMGVAARFAKNLNPHPPGGSAISGSRSEATHPLLEQVIQKAIEMGRVVHTEICRELSAAPASGFPQQPPAPASAETLTDDEKSTNLTVALDAYERKIFLKAITHCRTIRELAGHLQTSPATALRKLKKHRLSLMV